MPVLSVPFDILLTTYLFKMRLPSMIVKFVSGEWRPSPGE